MQEADRSHRPFVYVLVLSYNGRKWLAECVDTLLAMDYPDFRVLVIDNGSTDGTRDYLAERYGDRIDVLWLHENYGYSGGFNHGLVYAFAAKRADYVMVINNDTAIDKKALSALVEVAVTDPMIGFVSGKVYYYEDPKRLQTCGKSEDPIRWNGEHIGWKEIDTGAYDEVAERVFLDDIYCLVSRRVYETVGGYSTTFFLQSEEYDWQARAKAKGFRLMYTPHARLWHKESMTIGKDSPLKAFYDARNPMIVLMLHRSPDYFRRYFRQHARMVVRRSLVYAKRLRLYSALRVLHGLCSGLYWGFAHRKLTARHFIGPAA